MSDVYKCNKVPFFSKFSERNPKSVYHMNFIIYPTQSCDKDDDEVIAKHFRNLGIKTQNDNTKFLAEFGRLMFDSLQSKHFI